jgi:hypothetical protein
LTSVWSSGEKECKEVREVVEGTGSRGGQDVQYWMKEQQRAEGERSDLSVFHPVIEMDLLREEAYITSGHYRLL